MRTGISRRGFVGAAIAAGASLGVLGANDRIRLGAIGTGNRGKNLVKHANLAGGIEWVAVCDAWDTRASEAAEIVGARVMRCNDYRRVLDRQDIDGVIIATFDNTHAKIATQACLAGKDVYVEKPMTSEAAQGPGLVRTVRETKRVLQVGIQRRSTPHFIEAKQRIFDSGFIGQVNMVHTFWHGNPGYLYNPPPGTETKPADLNWEACLGSLPKIPWDPRRYFNRFAYWDFGTGGQTGGLFVHLVDVAHWFLGLTKPMKAVAVGGIYRLNDGRDTPDNVNALVEYPEKVTVTFDASLTDMIPYEPVDPITFRGSDGRFVISRRGYTFSPNPDWRPHLQEIKVGGNLDQDLKGHVQNWLDCMRSRKNPNADAKAGYHSAMACHMVNLAYRHQTTVTWRKEWDLPVS